MFDDSMKDFQKIFQTPLECMYKYQLVCVTAPSPDSLFCTDAIESIELQAPEPRRAAVIVP